MSPDEHFQNSMAARQVQFDGSVQVRSVFPGVIVPEGFVHKSYCVCYEPNNQTALPTLELAKLGMLSEQEAREELALNIVTMQKMRAFYRTKQMFMTQKFQDQINLLKK